MINTNQQPTKFTVPAKDGRFVRLKEGDTIRIINDEGTQVIDFWCIALYVRVEYLSM